MRQGKISRNTGETRIKIEIDIDGQGESTISTGIGFFDHMLTALSKHSGIDMYIKCDGDLNVDGHHTVEDVGIVLGKAFAQALGDKKGIGRYGSGNVPMDEALVRADLDISGRPFLVFNADFTVLRVGDFDVELTEEFFRAFAFNAGITLHINKVYGSNNHHIIEAMFKALAVALKNAVKIDPKYRDLLPSTKGVLE